MSEKLKLFDYDDPVLGNVKIKGKPQGSVQIEVKIGSGAWVDYDPEPTGPYNDPILQKIDYGYILGSRWVYINGRWYKIG